MKALLLHPEFSPHGFWNYKEVCRLLGARYPASPLGLVTMAALLPAEWEVRLVDLNARRLDDGVLDWADLVFVGGMLSQQAETLGLIRRAHERGKRVVVGGPDPTSQPGIYAEADYLVLGEAERTLPLFLADLARGADSGTYRPGERIEMTESPVPRFDLLRLRDYVMIGVQTSRGCPFDCEFCDIVELYGRKPRSKSPEQVVRELEALYALGHRGHVDLVDDNFIGHKARAKAILRAMKAWSDERGHPFYYSTEASLNLSDDHEMLALMQALDFRYVFVGLESPDEATLAAVGKRANVHRDLVRDVHEIQRYGIVVNAGFILGFDHEDRDAARRMADLVRESRIPMAMVGLLYALPHTRLTRRLATEGRLLLDHGAPIPASPTHADQVSSGLNFVTVRPRAQVIGDLVEVVGSIYAARAYFDRCLDLCRGFERQAGYAPSWRRVLSLARGFVLTSAKLGFRPSTAWLYWRNLFRVLFTRISAVETLVNLMAMYIHFRKQSRFILLTMRGRLAEGAGANGLTRASFS